MQKKVTFSFLITAIQHLHCSYSPFDKPTFQQIYKALLTHTNNITIGSTQCTKSLTGDIKQYFKLHYTKERNNKKSIRTIFTVK